MTSYDDVIEALRTAGYARSTAANRWGAETWSRKGCPAVRVQAECSAAQAEKVRMQVEKDLTAAAHKKKPKAFRIRATAAQKSAATQKRLAEIEARIALSNRELGGMREFITGPEARAIQKLIEADEREQRSLRALMTEIPTNNAHAGRVTAQHRS